jgi:hypothetical protein
MHQGGHNVKRIQKEVFEFNPEKMYAELEKVKTRFCLNILRKM